MTLLSLKNTADIVFLFCYKEIFLPLTPPGECHCNMGVLGSSREIFPQIIKVANLKLKKTN